MKILNVKICIIKTPFVKILAKIGLFLAEKWRLQYDCNTPILHHAG